MAPGASLGRGRKSQPLELEYRDVWRRRLMATCCRLSLIAVPRGHSYAFRRAEDCGGSEPLRRESIVPSDPMTRTFLSPWLGEKVCFRRNGSNMARSRLTPAFRT